MRIVLALKAPHRFILSSAEEFEMTNHLSSELLRSP